MHLAQGYEEELDLDAAQFVEAMAGVNLEDMSGMYVMQTVSDALQKLQTPVRIVLQCLGIQTTSQLDSPDPNAIHCRQVVCEMARTVSCHLMSYAVVQHQGWQQLCHVHMSCDAC